MSGIKIKYSWGEEEELIECIEEDAWQEMLNLVVEEIRIVTDENEENCSADFYKNTCEINLHYHYDDEYCYYRFIDEENEEDEEEI